MATKEKDLSDLRFGRWSVQGQSKLENKKRKWLCVCDCGTERYVDENSLLRGRSKSCGCLSADRARDSATELTGMKFGFLTARARAESKNGCTYWLCDCECGNSATVATRQLVSGKTKSCGCLKSRMVRENRRIRDITGLRSGQLTALRPTGARNKKGSAMWLCVCDCGNEVELPEDVLAQGSYKSCGCLKKERMKSINTQLHFVDGTCVEWIKSRKHRSDNTSGFRGVYKISEHSYKVTIGFKGERHYLGSFDSFDDAVAARLKAEEKYFKPFLEQYFKENLQGGDKPEPEPAELSTEKLTMEETIVNKTELITAAASETQLTKKDTELAVNAILNEIITALEKGDKVQLMGFGTFETRRRAARTGKDPRTGEETLIAERVVPVFKPGKVFRETVNK